MNPAKPQKHQASCGISPRRRALLLTALVLIATACPPLATAGESTTTTPATTAEIPWRTDLNAALSDAKKQDKLVLLRFTAGWCAPCRVMDARVWPDPAVQAALADKYLIVKSDVDAEGTLDLARRYKVQGVPTLLVLSAGGAEIDRAGFMSSGKLVQFLNAAAGPKRESELSANVKL